MPKPDLHSLSRDFADSITGMLNKTVTDGLTLSAVIARRQSSPVVFVGYGLTKHLIVPEKAFPLREAQGQPLFLSVYFKLQLDPEMEFLIVGSSSFGVYPSETMEEALFRYEYERDKPDGFPEAHLHVSGDWTIAGRPAVKLHLPLGDRRFRPCLEDLVQFLIVEGGSEPRTSDWKMVLDGNRQEFFKQQFRALIRRNWELARNVIDEFAPENLPPGPTKRITGKDRK